MTTESNQNPKKSGTLKCLNLKKEFNYVSLLIFFSLISLSSLKSQTIPANFFGINGWMTHSIGTQTLYGKLDAIWSPTANVIKDLSAKVCRYGGYDNDANGFPSYTNTLTSECALFINKARQNGMEPIIQIPFLYMLIAQYPNAALSLTTAISNATANTTYTADVINFVTALTTTYNIKYFSISNEPDIWALTTPASQSVASVSSASQIAMYFRPISQWIKQVNPNAIVVGPDLASAQSWPNGLMNGLIDKNANLGAGDITGTITANGKNWCDIISFHTYPYGVSTTARSAVIAQPSGAFATQLNDLRTLMADPNKNANPNLKIGVTEFNITYANTTGSNTINDAGANSFLAGQWMAEIFANGLVTPAGKAQVAFMIPWSIHEGSGGAGTGDLGILHGTNTLTPGLRSTYNHIKLMADGFKAGTAYLGVTTNTNVKAFSSKNCKEVSVMFLNQDLNTRTLTVSFNSTAPSSPVDVGVTLKIPTSWGNQTYTIGAQETILFVYNGCGGMRRQSVYNTTTNTTYTTPILTTYYTPINCNCSKYNPYVEYSPPPSLRCAVPTETGGVHYNSVTLSANTTIRDSAYVTGTLTVPDRITLTIDAAEVSFGTNARILVEAGGKLAITNGTLHGCPGYTWEGIKINGNNSASQFTMTNSFVSGAVVAVNANETNEPLISQNVFGKGTQAIRLNKTTGFTITNNEFLDLETCIKTSSCNTRVSSITENFFYDADTCISFKDDTHDQLNITCNGFVDYSEFGIYSNGSALQTQGFEDVGPGNQFISSSRQTNHQLYFLNGTATTYFNDPSYSFTLNTAAPFNARTADARSDASCTQQLGRLAAYYPEAESMIESISLNTTMLLGCMPNPSADRTTFTYNLANTVKSAEIRISNMFGEVLNSIPLAQGSHSVESNVSTYVNGIYFYTLIVNGNIVSSKKLIISK